MMVSKRDKRKLARLLEKQDRLMSLELNHLLIEDLRYERRMRNRAINMDRKRRKQTSEWIV